MLRTHLGFAFLIWFPAVLHVSAQSAKLLCEVPHQESGVFLVPHTRYAERDFSYSCISGLKPVVEGWWVRITCENGTWSHTIKCIDEFDCIPPNIQNAKFTVPAEGFFKNNGNVTIKCDEGYEVKTEFDTGKCDEGKWKNLPSCEKSKHSCSAPPQIPHAVIIHKRFQEVFAADSVVGYECENGYTTEGGDAGKSMHCISGNWTQGPKCILRTVTEKTDVGPTEVETEGRGPTSTGQGGRHEGGGSSTTSEGSPALIPVSRCGRPPNVANGEVIVKERMYVKYQCITFYKFDGPDTVMCYSDGTWSKLPVCKEDFCKLDPAEYPSYSWQQGIEVQFLKGGETTIIPCEPYPYYMPVKCMNNKLTLAQQCCLYNDYARGVCL